MNNKLEDNMINEEDLEISKSKRKKFKVSSSFLFTKNKITINKKCLFTLYTGKILKFVLKFMYGRIYK